MFGGKWGAFDTKGHHFFNEKHFGYKAIAKIAWIRAREAALRYGRQYFREISGNGVDFGFPIDGQCTMAYSRILDDTEIIIALNLASQPKSDYVTVDHNLMPAGKNLTNLLDPGFSYAIKTVGNRRAVQVPLNAHEMAILKLQDG